MKKKILIKIVRILFSVSLFRKYFLLVGKFVAITGYGSNECLKEGFLPVPVHYYSPIPDINDLEKRNIWNKKSELQGIKFDPKKQLAFLKQLRPFGEECVWPLNKTSNEADYFVDNDSFSFGCAAALYSMIRKYKPRTVIEIGSGHSSKIIAQSINANNKEMERSVSYIIIDPYPQNFIKNNKISYTKLIPKKIEVIKPTFFNILEKNDILFVDSSHTVKIGSDVNFLILDILPRLHPGVIIHFHDIHLPFEYPKAYATTETFRQFWTEQYLLQGFLSFNKEFEILIAMNYLMYYHINEFKKSFPNYNPRLHKASSGSFYIRRNKRI